MIDLQVYYESAGHLWDGATLYTFRTSGMELPFTYPPFAALLFASFGWVPWAVCRVLWQLASVAALWMICRLSLRLADTHRATRPLASAGSLATLITAGAIWTEPVRATLLYGQVNLFITAVLLVGLTSRHAWVGGVTVGLTAAVKLVPGVGVLFLLLSGRTRSVLIASASLVGSFGIGYLIAPSETRDFLLRKMFDADRAGDVTAVSNQSLRGALARILGQDNQTLWLVAAAAALSLGIAATRARLRRSDTLGAFLAVQFIGLLVSPISWNHHWVWVVPLVIWAERGPLRRSRSTTTLSTLWILSVGSFIVSIQIDQQTNAAGIAAGWTTWALAIYPILGLLTLAAMWLTPEAGDAAGISGGLFRSLGNRLDQRGSTTATGTGTGTGTGSSRVNTLP